MNRIAMLITPVLLSAGVLTACGGGADQPPPASPPATTDGQYPITTAPPTTARTTTPAQAARGEIVISDFTYTVPAPVKPGQQVTVVNNADLSHTVTSDANNLFDVRISGGGGYSTFTAPTAPGTYPFYCKYHANMHGSLTVQ